MFSFDLLRMMEAITEAVESYAQLYTDYVERLGLGGGTAPAAVAVPAGGGARSRKPTPTIPIRSTKCCSA